MNNSNRLKSETQEFHDRTEKVMNATLLFSNLFNSEHYQNFILKSYRYISTIQQATTSNWPIYDDIITRKQNALLIDISHLGGSNILPNKENVNNSDKFYSLGLIYIILGAMLGNKIILKKLHEYPTFTNYPFAYLSEHQQDFGEIWKDFQKTVDNLDKEQLDRVIEGAKDGYLLFSE